MPDETDNPAYSGESAEGIGDTVTEDAVAGVLLSGPALPYRRKDWRAAVDREWLAIGDAKTWNDVREIADRLEAAAKRIRADVAMLEDDAARIRERQPSRKARR